MIAVVDHRPGHLAGWGKNTSCAAPGRAHDQGPRSGARRALTRGPARSWARSSSAPPAAGTPSRTASSGWPRRSGSASIRTGARCRRNASWPRRMGVSRATLREAIAALRTANMVRTTRGRGGGTRRRPSAGHAGEPAVVRARWPPRGRADGLPGLPAGRRARGLLPGRRHGRSPRTSDELLTQAHDRGSGGGQPGRAPTGRLAAAPGDRGTDRVGAADRRGDRGPGRPARHADRHPGAAGQHRALQPPARRDRRCDPARQRPPRPAGDGESLRRHRGTAARAAGMREESTAMTELRNDRHLSVHDLRRRISEGDIDTVVVAFTDMQGRLQGKRMHGAYFAEHVLEHGTEGCNYLLAVDIDMNTVDGLRHLVVGSRLRRHGVRPRPADDPAAAAPAGHGDGAVRPGLARPLPGPAVAADDPEDPVRPGGEPGHRGAGRHRAGVHRLQHQLRGGVELATTATWSRSTSTTSTTRSWAAAGPSRCCGRSATPCTPPGWTSSRPRGSATSASTRSASSTPTR